MVNPCKSNAGEKSTCIDMTSLFITPFRHGICLCVILVFVISEFSRRRIINFQGGGSFGRSFLSIFFDATYPISLLVESGNAFCAADTKDFKNNGLGKICFPCKWMKAAMSGDPMLNLFTTQCLLFLECFQDVSKLPLFNQMCFPIDGRLLHEPPAAFQPHMKIPRMVPGDRFRLICMPCICPVYLILAPASWGPRLQNHGNYKGWPRLRRIGESVSTSRSGDRKGMVLLGTNLKLDSQTTADHHAFHPAMPSMFSGYV